MNVHFESTQDTFSFAQGQKEGSKCLEKTFWCVSNFDWVAIQGDKSFENRHTKNSAEKATNKKKTRKTKKDLKAEEDNTECLVCGDIYGHSKSKETWIKCNICQNWAHEKCTSYTRTGLYVCDNWQGDLLEKTETRTKRKNQL